jgi:FMN phosphatase YigB (HAD superfamily)
VSPIALREGWANPVKSIHQMMWFELRVAKWRFFVIIQSMHNIKVVLFDVDGVLVQAPKLFSEVYCEKYNINYEKLEPFFKSKEFKDCSAGKIDLKEALTIHNDKWRWKGDLDELISEWIQAENFPNIELLEIVENLREGEIKVYIVTQQEKYRKDFLNKIVFKEKFDGFFASCDLGLHKDTIEFWNKILELLQKDNRNLKPEDIVYFDDKQKLVDLANTIGINAYLYTSIDDVKRILS